MALRRPNTDREAESCLINVQCTVVYLRTFSAAICCLHPGVPTGSTALRETGHLMGIGTLMGHLLKSATGAHAWPEGEGFGGPHSPETSNIENK